MAAMRLKAIEDIRSARPPNVAQLNGVDGLLFA
jgi:hypothetical protein